MLTASKPVIAFSMFEQGEAIHQMQDAGASGYIMKNSSLKSVVAAIRAVTSGDTYFDASIKSNSKNNDNDIPLSKREMVAVVVLLRRASSACVKPLSFNCV